MSVLPVCSNWARSRVCIHARTFSDAAQSASGPEQTSPRRSSGSLATEASEPELRRGEVCSGPEARCAASLNVLAWIQTLERAQFEQTGSTDIELACAAYATVGDVRLAVYGVLDSGEGARDDILAGVVKACL